MSKVLTSDHELKIVLIHDGNVFFCIDKTDEDLGELFPDKVEHGNYDFCIGESNVESADDIEAFMTVLRQLEEKITRALTPEQI